MNGIAIEISKVPVDCTLTPPIPPHKILFKSKSYFSLQLTVYVCLKILEFCLYCKFFYMSYIPVPCLNLSSLDSHKVDSTGE